MTRPSYATQGSTADTLSIGPAPRAAVTSPGRLGGLVVLFATLVCIIVPLAPRMPSPGLDDSWMMAMNDAAARALPIGKAIVFTFGPYASLYTRVYHPVLDGRMLIAGTVIAWQCFVCIRALTRGRRPAALVARAAVFIFCTFSYDAILLCAALSVGLRAWQLAIPQRDVADAVAPLRAGALSIAFAFVALGLLTLVKVTFVVLGAPLLCLALAMFAWARRGDLMVAATAGFGSGVVAFWIVAGQRLLDLPAYFIGSIDIITGYTDAMSSAGNPAEVVVFWTAAVLTLLAIVSRAALDAPSRFWLAAIVGLVIFTASKSGFVRQDFHAPIASATLLLTAMLVRMSIASSLASIALVAAGCAAIDIDSAYWRTSTADLMSRSSSTYRSAWMGVRSRLDGSRDLLARYESAFAALRQERSYPLFTGTTDIYSSDQAHLIASGNIWNPRPVFQSYSVYNPTLAEMNREHLVGRDAPDHILVRIEPIDAHPPLSEDGPSWPELLARYRPTTVVGGVLFLDRRETPAAATRTELSSDEHQFGETVALSGSTIDFVKLDIRPTLVGRIVSFLFRLDPPHLEMRLEDGTSRDYRVVPGALRAGFIASPVVDTVAEAADLYDPQVLAGKRVKSIVVRGPAESTVFGRSLWSPRYSIESSSISIAGNETRVQAAPIPRKLEDPSPAESAEVDCVGSIDLINGARDFTGLVAKDRLTIDGWMDQGSAALPARDVLITLTDMQGRRRFVPTHATLRADVANYFKRPELHDAGYTTIADLTGIDGTVFVGLAYRNAGRLVRCRQFAIPIALERR